MPQTPRSVDAGIVVGQIFLGKYRVESILGHGGMGVVAKCIHLALGEMFAVKMLRQDVLLDRDATERFTREAQAASKLKSEHVARVIDVGTSEAGIPYMIMEFLDGEDLGQMVDDRGSIQAPFASMLMLQACEALCEAHANNIVHRDVKPSNLFVTWRPDGSALVKVLDFGISKSPTGTDMKLTQTQSLLGTPAYMSPEQMRSARLVDARTDIWSLGTVFYELLEGRRPFEAESFSEMCVKVAVDPPSPMVNAPLALQQIILRCLAKNPDQRYANMAELARDLLPHVQDVHQATLLVDRMQRMLGRRSAVSGDQWEAPQTGVGNRVPAGVRDAGSAPVAVPWNPDPLAAPSPTPSPFGDTRAPTATLKEDSRPARALSEISTKPANKSKFPLFLLGFLALGAVLGLVLYKALGDGDDPKQEVASNNHVSAPTGDAPLKVDPPPKPDQPTKPDDKAGSAEIKKADPIPPPDPNDEALVVAFERMAELAGDKATNCSRWDAAAVKYFGKGGYASAAAQLGAYDDAKKKLFNDTFGERVGPKMAIVQAQSKKCDDYAKQLAAIAAKNGNGKPQPPRPPEVKCGKGEHKNAAGKCERDEAKTVPVEPPKPPPDGVRSPNGKCGLYDKTPSGGWPERCVK